MIVVLFSKSDKKKIGKYIYQLPIAKKTEVKVTWHKKYDPDIVNNNLNTDNKIVNLLYFIID